MSDAPFTAWPVSGLEKVFADALPGDVRPSAIKLAAAAGECEVAQIAVHASGGELMLHAPQVSPVCGEGSVTCNFIELVPVRFSSQDVPPEELLRVAPDYFPDPLCHEKYMHVPAGQTRAIWVRIEVPAGTAPGSYEGAVTVNSDRGAIEIPIRLTVWPFELPKQIPFGLTLWVWPSIIAEYHCVKLYSDEFWAVLESYAVQMAARRQDTIFTPIVGPESLIDVTKSMDGSYRFDFTNFDRWVKLFFDAGFTRIEGAHVYDDSIKYQRIVDEKTAGLITLDNGAKAENFDDDDQYVAMLRQLFAAMPKHLQEHGWQDCYIQHVFDEPQGPMVDVYLKLAGVLREVWPEVKFIDAADAKPQLFDVIDTLVPLCDHRTIFGDAQKFLKAGKTLWSYTCNHPRGRYPGAFLDQALIKTRIMPWILWRYGGTGFLYYALGHWAVQYDVERNRFDPFTGESNDSVTLYNPWNDAVQNATWRCPPGSSGFAYPPRDLGSQDPKIMTPRLVENFIRLREGGESVTLDESPLPDRMQTSPDVVVSIRWEQLREGIEDYGLLCILRDEIEKAPEDKALKAQTSLNTLIMQIAPDWLNYTRNPADIDRARQHVVELILSLRV